MKDKLVNIFNNLSIDDQESAVMRAFRKHGGKREVIEFKEDLSGNCKELYILLMSGRYGDVVEYWKLVKVNNNGKVRHIDSPFLKTRIYQHLALNILEPIYFSKDNLNGLNCKRDAGITAGDKRRSVVHRMKHIYYDETHLKYCLVIDQRKCYEHVRVWAFRNGLTKLVSDKKLIDFVVDVCFVNGRLPIGTPTSPFVHHVLMLSFDYFVKGMTSYSVRYADDNFLAFETKEEAQAAKWRIKNYWWYELGIRCKRHTVRIQSMDEPLDFCGYVFHRNNKPVASHNKGYTTVRKSTVADAMRCNNDRSWASYFGILKHADTWSLMRNIEKTMKLRELTGKIKIDRRMDARNILPKDLIGETISICDYEIRTDSKGNANWIKCLIGIDERDEAGEPTGKTLAREFHGNFQGIIQYILLCERTFGKKNFLPLEDVEIENQCGYIFKDSTNQLEYIEYESN